LQALILIAKPANVKPRTNEIAKNAIAKRSWNANGRDNRNAIAKRS
jgi:hypothetical protein